MNIRRNVFTIVVGALLMAALPAGAQVLGGSLGGAMHGALGGRLGGAGIDGSVSAAGNAGIDASGAPGAAHDRVHQAAGRSREVAGNAVGSARSQVATARGAAEATVQSAHSAGARAGRHAARSAAQASTSVQQSAAAPANREGGGLLLNGSGEGNVGQRIAGRTVDAQGAVGAQASANRSGLTGSVSGQSTVSTQKAQ